MSDPPPAATMPRAPVGAAPRTRAPVGAAILCAALAACAGEPAPFEAKDDPGTGTGTLNVQAALLAVPRLANTTDPGAFDTAFSVRVELLDRRITNGSVIVSSVAGPASLHFDTRDGGSWIGGQPGYHRVYRLDVVMDADLVEDVRMVGPDIHALTAPMADAMVDSTLPLQVGWSRAAPSKFATVRTLAAVLPIEDLGTAMVVAGTLTSAPDHTEAEILALDRIDALAIDGGTLGSSITITVRNHVKLTVLPPPRRRCRDR